MNWEQHMVSYWWKEQQWYIDKLCKCRSLSLYHEETADSAAAMLCLPLFGSSFVWKLNCGSNFCLHFLQRWKDSDWSWNINNSYSDLNSQRSSCHIRLILPHPKFFFILFFNCEQERPDSWPSAESSRCRQREPSQAAHRWNLEHCRCQVCC